jgi:prepilin-type N-terminal cleavage/methylation domain-containing protein
MKRTRGFSLIELLIVVAIILIIAAIAIPNLLRARISANESSAVSSVRQIANGEIEYAAAYPTVGYTTLANLGGASPCSPSVATACIIDNTLAGGAPKSGYTVNGLGFGGVPNTTFVTGAAPVTYNVTGVRDFCVTTDGVVHVNPGAAGAVPAPDVPTCLAYSILN